MLSCVLLFLVGLLFDREYVEHGMLTRVVTVSSNKYVGFVNNDIVDKYAEEEEENVDSNKGDDIVGKYTENRHNNSNKDDDSEDLEQEDNNIEDNNSELSLADLESVMAYKSTMYDGMTVEELASKLERSLKNELSGKGYLYASYSLEKGVDPYLAVAISLEETGCNWNCSRLVKSCNNVGGMKGKGCGSYGAFLTLDDGIKAFIDNIYRNYVAYGLTTADTMNPKYAENPKWSENVNAYIRRIKNS